MYHPQYPPRSVMELSVLQCLTTILSKPNWWVKWQDQTIRHNWLEMFKEMQLHIGAFDHIRDDEKRNCGYYKFDGELEEILKAPASPEKNERAAAWLVSPLWWVANQNKPENGAISKNEQELSPSSSLDERKEKQEALSRIKLLVNEVWLRDKMHAVPFERWTMEDSDVQDAVYTAKSCVRDRESMLSEIAVDFVLSVLESEGLTHKTKFTRINSVTWCEEESMKVLQLYCEKIGEELEALQVCFVNTLDIIIERGELSSDAITKNPNRSIITPGGTYGLWICDNLIDDELSAKFVGEVAELENVPDDRKDWHPKSNQQVLDLVHPSLYCCVFGQTMQIPQPLDPTSYSTPTEQMAKIMLMGTQQVENTRDKETAFQWIPTDFQVNDDGSVRILSYINNLHPVQHSMLYESIGKIFSRFVPLFDRVLSSGKIPDPVFEIPQLEDIDEKSAVPRPKIPSSIPVIESGLPTVTIKGKTVQVIVKIAEIVLTPENPKYDGGAWHMEGTDTEQIVATGIYYFGCENIKDSSLGFAIWATDPEWHHNDHIGAQTMYGFSENQNLVQYLGGIQTIDSRCIAFPNMLLHIVRPFELDDPTKPGVRKILAFFLVNPSTTIPSTAVIPPQQQEWIDIAQQPALKKLCMMEPAEQIVREMMGNGMTLDEAKTHRIALMEERSAREEDMYNYDTRIFSLCEH